VTDAELRDAALVELEQTTVGYRNTHWQTPPAGTHWRKGLDLLAQIGATVPTPTPTGFRLGISENIGGGGDKQALLAFGAKLIREDTPAAIPWATQNGIDVLEIVYPGETGDPGAYAYEVVANPSNEPYWHGVDPVAWAPLALAQVKAVRAAHGPGKPIIIPLVAYGGRAGANGMDGIDYPGEYAYPNGGTPYMVGHKPWVSTIEQAAPGLLAAVDGFSVHPYWNDPPFHVLDVVRAELHALGHEHPFWITESGAAMTPSVDGPAQAARFAAEIAAVQARTDVACYVVYRLSENSEGSLSWGLLNADGSLRPAYQVCKAAL
jgi:hypothetical protein